jgi:putative ATPase
MAIAAWETFDRLGAPEGELALAQLTLYLASCAKSNAGYVAWKAAKADVAKHGTLEVPMHLRNAPTALMKGLGYGQGYQYDPDVDGGVALGQVCLPDALDGRVYYQPVARGMEIKLKEKLDALREARRAARAERRTGSTSRGGQGT